MKKITQLFVLVVAVAILSTAQSTVKAQAFKNGDMVANLGAGFGWYSYGYGVSSLPAISLSLEKGIKDIDNVGPLSIGGIVGFKHATYAWSSSYDWSWTDYVVAARAGIHYDFLKNEKLDTYGGIAVGLRFQSESYYSWVPPYGVNDYKKITDSSAHPLFAFYIGGRYYFTDKIAGFGELGYGLGYFTLGLSYKFN
jgi:hypothetical protein